MDKLAVNQTLEGDAGEHQVTPREEHLSTNVLQRTFPVEGGTSTPGRFKKGSMKAELAFPRRQKWRINMSINMMCAQSPKTPPEEEKTCFAGCQETRDQDPRFLLTTNKKEKASHSACPGDTEDLLDGM